MSTIKEYREFFLRAVKVPVGTKADKELNYPTQYQVTDINGKQIMAFNRFLKEHFPSEDVFKKLFESVAFKLNPEDTATVGAQGLVRIVTGENVINRLDTITDGSETFATVVVPSNLPVVEGGTNINVVAEIVRSSDDVVVPSIPPGDTQSYYVKYTVNSTAPVPSPTGGGISTGPGDTVVLGGPLDDGPTVFDQGAGGNSAVEWGTFSTPITQFRAYVTDKGTIINTTGNTSGISAVDAGSGLELYTTKTDTGSVNEGDILKYTSIGQVEFSPSVFKLDFVAADFVGANLLIPVGDHEMGLYPHVQVYEAATRLQLVPGGPAVTLNAIKLDLNGDVTITWGTGAFDGTVIIK